MKEPRKGVVHTLRLQNGKAACRLAGPIRPRRNTAPIAAEEPKEGATTTLHRGTRPGKPQTRRRSNANDCNRMHCNLHSDRTTHTTRTTGAEAREGEIPQHGTMTVARTTGATTTAAAGTEDKTEVRFGFGTAKRRPAGRCQIWQVVTKVTGMAGERRFACRWLYSPVHVPVSRCLARAVRPRIATRRSRATPTTVFRF